MTDPTKMTDTTPKAGKLTDAVTKWEADTARAPAALGEVRLDANGKILIPFTTSVVETQVHYLGYPSIRGYVRCNGPDCALCRIGRRPDERDLLPVYGVIGKRVGVLPVSPSMRPGALRTQVLPVLRQLQDQRLVTIVRRPDRGQFQ